MNRTVSAFVSKLRQLLVISGISDVKVKLYAAVQDQNNKRDSDTSTRIL